MALSRRTFLRALLAGGAASVLPQVSRLIEAWAASPVRDQAGRLRRWMKAIYFGDAGEDVVTNGREIFRLSALLSGGHAYRYKEELGTEPRVYYLPPRAG